MLLVYFLQRTTKCAILFSYTMCMGLVSGYRLLWQTLLLLLSIILQYALFTQTTRFTRKQKLCFFLCKTGGSMKYRHLDLDQEHSVVRKCGAGSSFEFI